jgi:hypothetical protein
LVGEEVRRFHVKKVEMKGGARIEVERGPAALNYNPEFKN